MDQFCWNPKCGCSLNIHLDPTTNNGYQECIGP